MVIVFTVNKMLRIPKNRIESFLTIVAGIGSEETTAVSKLENRPLIL